ncbi:MAG: hypothetical protein JNM96_05605, partial [Bacteroidia bacterium]|nr:hypothetical protein [Bacteroidia bacterium]
MRNTIIKSIFLIMPFILLSLGSCKKNVPGPKGDSGEDGGQGNLVQSERTFTIYPSSWTFNGSRYSAQVYFPEITNDVLTKGEVRVYMKIGNEWWSLPYAVADVFMRQSIELGYIHLEYLKIHGVPPASPGQVTFR